MQDFWHLSSCCKSLEWQEQSQHHIHYHTISKSSWSTSCAPQTSPTLQLGWQQVPGYKFRGGEEGTTSVLHWLNTDESLNPPLWCFFLQGRAACRRKGREGKQQTASHSAWTGSWAGAVVATCISSSRRVFFVAGFNLKHMFFLWFLQLPGWQGLVKYNPLPLISGNLSKHCFRPALVASVLRGRTLQQLWLTHSKALGYSVLFWTRQICLEGPLIPKLQWWKVDSTEGTAWGSLVLFSHLHLKCWISQALPFTSPGFLIVF